MIRDGVEYAITLKDLFSQQISRARKESDKLNQSVGNTKTAIGGLGGMVAGAFGTYALVNFAKSVVDVGSKFESAEMGLKTFLKTSKASHQTFLDIQQDAVKTPFSFDALLQGNRALISSGMSAKSAREDILALGNAIASTGGGNDELNRMSVNMLQIKNTGKATALDIKQFAFAGVNIYKLLADATGKSTEEVKGMEVSYDLLTYALKKAGQEGGIYYKGLDNAMNTTKGRLSNLGDQFDMFKYTLFNELKPAIGSIVDGLSGLMNGIVSAVQFMKKYSTEIKTAIFVVGGLTLAYKAQSIITSLVLLKTKLLTAGSILNTVVTIAQITATEGLTAGMWALNVAMMANPVGLIIAGLVALGAVVYYCWNKFAGFRKAMKVTWEVIKGLGKAIWSQFIMPFKVAYNVVAGLINLLSGDWGAAKNNMTSIGKAITDPYKQFGKGLGNATKEYNKVEKKTGKKSVLKVAGSKQQKSKINAPAKIKQSSSKGESSNVQQKQAVQVHITIGKMIESQIVNVNNASKDFKDKLHNAVSEVLLNVVNDANRIATQ